MSLWVVIFVTQLLSMPSASRTDPTECASPPIGDLEAIYLKTDLIEELDDGERVKAIPVPAKLKEGVQEITLQNDDSAFEYRVVTSHFDLVFKSLEELSEQSLIDYIEELSPVVRKSLENESFFGLSQADTFRNPEHTDGKRTVAFDFSIHRHSMLNAFASSDLVMVFYEAFRKRGLSPEQIHFILMHELGHHGFERLTNGPLELPDSDFNAALNEAFADFFAYTITGRTELFNSHSQKLRQLENEFDYEFFRNAPHPHEQSQFFSGTFVDMARALGVERASSIIGQALRIYKDEWWRNMEVDEIRALRSSLITASESLYGSEHTDKLNEIFERRGFPPPRISPVGPQYLPGRPHQGLQLTHPNLYLSPFAESSTYVQSALVSNRDSWELIKDHMTPEDYYSHRVSSFVGWRLNSGIYFSDQGEPLRMVMEEDPSTLNSIYEPNLRLEWELSATPGLVKVIRLNDTALSPVTFAHFGSRSILGQRPLFYLVPASDMPEDLRPTYDLFVSELQKSFGETAQIKGMSPTEYEGFTVIANFMNFAWDHWDKIEQAKTYLEQIFPFLRGETSEVERDEWYEPEYTGDDS